MHDQIIDSMDEVIDNAVERELTPKQYFDQIKDKKHHITDEELLRLYDNCLVLLNKYKITNQVRAMKKLIFHLENLEKERSIVKAGVSTFIYRDDIEEFITNVAKNTVKIIELENYEREIPDEIVEVIEKVGSKFDKLYVLFTDYTGNVERTIQKERREKDPILFGTFQDTSNRAIVDRFYFLGDWEDEYCDLTLDKMVTQVKEKKNKDIAMSISTPEDIATLKAQLSALVPSQINSNLFVQNISSPQKEEEKGFFKNIRSIFSGKK